MWPALWQYVKQNWPYHAAWSIRQAWYGHLASTFLIQFVINLRNKDSRFLDACPLLFLHGNYTMKKKKKKQNRQAQAADALPRISRCAACGSTHRAHRAARVSSYSPPNNGWIGCEVAPNEYFRTTVIDFTTLRHYFRILFLSYSNYFTLSVSGFVILFFGFLL